jgi:hypothetical protein
MTYDDLIRRGEAVEMLLAMRGPVDVPRTEKAVWLDEGIDRCIEELRALPAALIPQPAPDVGALAEALRECVAMLDALVKESGRGVDWGEEDPFRMGEWFEDQDLASIEAARATLAKIDPKP